MDDVAPAAGTAPRRGQSTSHMRAFTCKDCQREVEHLEAELVGLERSGGTDKRRLSRVRAELDERRARAVYNENWARNLVERGGSRSDRCKDHRLKHRTNIQGMAVAYIDLQTVGEVADRENPTGPLGGLGPLPVAHEVVSDTSYNLQEVKVGMTDEHVTKMITLLREKRVLILKAGTGTGKSTFAPYRLMDPPPQSLRDLPVGAPFARLTDLGPIIVTEPRVQAAVGVASFVGGTMSGAGGVGPGFPVGYQVSGDRNHDEACELIYVTDGTMINWLREGRLSRIGTVIVDEAHERSTNIDFIMGYLKQELAKYPHLRLIITSATFNTDFYQEYFGGPGVANVMEVPAEKNFGYGMPLFPALDTAEDGAEDIYDRWTDQSLRLSRQQPRDEDAFIRQHWPERYAPPLDPDDVVDDVDAGREEDVWDTTAKLIDLRYDGHIPAEEWRERMPDEMAKFVIQLAKGLDEKGIFGDILGFLPTRRTIEPVCEEIQRALGRAYRDNVFPLISTLPPDRQRKALAKRRKGDARKIVISTNLAETSLTVEGVRFVVDSGVIAQSEWDPKLAQGGIPTKPHSQAGIKQRWGRVGRTAPGWVFPLYSKGQYLDLAQDTPPGSTRENLEALVMTAKMGGIDDVAGFPWPAAFQPATTELDASARESREVFLHELARADLALRAGGAVDRDGHPTSFGKELIRFHGLGSTASALAVLYADRLACVPEVVTILALLEDTRLIGQRGLLQDDYEWLDEWRLEAADRHRGLATLCADDAEIALLTAAAWERADPGAAPWEPSERRRTWARQWWVSHEVLAEAAVKRHDTLLALSPAMKEDVKRFLEPALIGRARGVLTRTFAAHLYERGDAAAYRNVHGRETAFTLEDDALVVPQSPRVIALRRRESRTDNRVSSLVIAQPWALPDGEPGTGEPGAGEPGQAPGGAADAMRMIVAAAKSAPAQPELTRALHYLASWPTGQRVRVEFADGEPIRVANVVERRAPFPCPQTDAGRGLTGERRGRGTRRRGRQPADDDLQGTRSDSDGEIRLRQRPAGYADEDAEHAAEFRDADRAAAASAPCGECFPCLDGRPDDCENLEGEREPSCKRSNPLQAWLQAARAGQDVSRPEVVIEPGTAVPGDWYEVAGYARTGDGQVAVRLRPDWRVGRPGNPAQHVDVKAGDAIEVTIGPVLRHHGGALRSFERTDGRGRFVVAEASSRRADVQERRREIAVSLDRGSTALLAGLVEGGTLTATVVPARADGCYTITLLELLHQHWAKAQSGNGVEYHVLDQTRRNTTRKPLYAVVVEEPPNENGFVTACLLHQDGTLGIRHHFDFNVAPRGGLRNAADGREAAGGQTHQATEPAPRPDPDQQGQGVGAQALARDEPLLLRIVTDQSRLEVSGLDLDVLTDIIQNSQRQLELTGIRDGEGGAGREREGKGNWDGEDGERLAPPGATLRPTTDKPLSRAAAELLCDLSDEPGWPNEVWSFWARSHHLMVHRQQPFLPGTSREPFDVPARVVLDTASPLDRQRQRVAAYRREHRVGAVVECVVMQVANQGAFVELGPDIEGLIPAGEVSWAARPGHPSQTVSPGDRLRALLTSIPDPPARIELSVRALIPDPFAAFKADHPVGTTVRGQTRAVTDSHAYLVLAEGVEGAIHVSQLAWRRVERVSDVLAEGTQVDAQVLSYDEGRRRAELSRKALFPKPYEAFKRAHSVDDVVIAEIRSATPTHVYVDLGEPDYPVAGVIYVREWAYEEIADISVHALVGKRGKAKIIKFDDKHEQVELSRKRLMPHPYEGYKRTHAVGTVATGRVRRVVPARVFLDLGGGVEGTIHVSQLDHEHVADASDFCPAGTVLEARITGFDDDRRQVELSRKDVLPRPFPRYKAAHWVGQVVAGVIRNTNKSFAYVDLGDGAQGVIHVSRLAPYRISQPTDVVSLGQPIRAQIIDYDDDREQVVLALYA
jgi:HrpA-like RNA helicase/ribosomal protein S1